MKSHILIQHPKTKKPLLSIVFFIMALLVLNSGFAQAQITKSKAQNITIKGLVTDGKVALKDVNVIQKGTRNGTVTNDKGEFIFPVPLKTGDVLLFSYLGYETQMIPIKENSTFIKLTLAEDLIEMIGALDPDIPYKSKRKN
ncbi:carboxypeptidase-like regulatory domain-containing protein [Winogradskyella sp. DF17]|uniref:Carboxypeptidase-like regulatory domain-containing protein n=1 Tax=Winogradskyella pelagia TaxID=2819984 RepID=A0ABS3SYW6_9FLAO|nr:carboxypeptidase-like regulatory domain-containing protein [Winogradskyella sp. DF17]MBO3115682.1 carboxypeptidase-like regulatory domain-containing protein [Winogradskyella sp. DF17]